MRVVKSSKPFKKLSSYFKSKKDKNSKKDSKSNAKDVRSIEEALNQILRNPDISLDYPDNEGNQIVYYLGEPCGVINMHRGIANLGDKVYKFNSYQVKANPQDFIPEIIRASDDMNSDNSLRHKITDALDDDLCVDIVNIGFSEFGNFEKSVFISGDSHDDDSNFFAGLIDTPPKDVAVMFFNGSNLDSHGPANPNSDYFRYDSKGNIESTDDPGAIYYDTILDEIVDFIMDNLDTLEFPNEIQDIINDYIGTAEKE